MIIKTAVLISKQPPWQFLIGSLVWFSKDFMNPREHPLIDVCISSRISSIMRWWAAVLLTFVLLVIGMCSPLWVIGLIVIGSATWTAIDSKKIGLTHYKSGISYPPIGLFFGILAVWIIAFPWYLTVRGQILRGAAALKD
jgi:hypothetical protein